MASVVAYNAEEEMAAPNDLERISLFFTVLLERYAELHTMEESTPVARADTGRIEVRAVEPLAGPDTSRALLDDVITLFGLGDLDGGLISFERLIFLHVDNPRVQAFIKKYQDKILRLYEDVYTKDDVALELGPGARDDRYVIYDAHEALAAVKEIVRTSDDGRVSSVLAASPYPALYTLALVNFLTRPGILRIVA